MELSVEAWLGQEDARTRDQIRTSRWMIEYVGGPVCAVPGCGGSKEHDGPPFAHTVGLHGMGHPELLVFGLGMESAQRLLNRFSHEVLEGRHFLAGERVDDPGDCRHHVVFEEIPNPQEILFGANRFYRLPKAFSVDGLQVTYADCKGRFPWDEGCEYIDLQPRPGEYGA